MMNNLLKSFETFQKFIHRNPVTLIRLGVVLS